MYVVGNPCVMRGARAPRGPRGENREGEFPPPNADSPQLARQRILPPKNPLCGLQFYTFPCESRRGTRTILLRRVDLPGFDPSLESFDRVSSFLQGLKVFVEFFGGTKLPVGGHSLGRPWSEIPGVCVAGGALHGASVGMLPDFSGWLGTHLQPFKVGAWSIRLMVVHQINGLRGPLTHHRSPE